MTNEKLQQLIAKRENLIYQLDNNPPSGLRLTLLKDEYNWICNEIQKHTK